jgi:hypothetical protein
LDHQLDGRSQYGVEHGWLACVDAPSHANAGALFDAFPNADGNAEHDVIDGTKG